MLSLSRSSLLILVASLLLCSCAKPYRPAQYSPPDAQFEGLVGLSKLPAARQKGLDVFFVHGICTKDKSWAVNRFAMVAKALNLPLPSDFKPLDGAGSDIIVYRWAIDLQGTQLRLHAIVWSPLTRGPKQRLCYDRRRDFTGCTQSSESIVDSIAANRAHENVNIAEWSRLEHARLNAQYKDVLVDDCLADALVYMGDSRFAMVQQMQDALMAASNLGPSSAAMSTELLARAAAENTAPLVIVAASLGSKMVFDSIYMMIHSPDNSIPVAIREAGRKLYARAEQVFMEANQIPLLALSDRASVVARSGRGILPGRNFPPDPLRALFGSTLQFAPLVARQEKLTVVAFTDPNDMLSFALGESKVEADGIRWIDAFVSNAWTYFGVGSHPIRAHTESASNPDVISAIVCGSKPMPCTE